MRESCSGQPLDALWRNSAACGATVPPVAQQCRFDPVALFMEEDPWSVTFNRTGAPGPASAYQPTGAPTYD
jgi:hypothetical protein